MHDNDLTGQESPDRLTHRPQTYDLQLQDADGAVAVVVTITPIGDDAATVQLAERARAAIEQKLSAYQVVDR